jgi:hypothetical protein
MAATKECPSCGAQNDVIFTNCIFCKSSLPQVDTNSITNDELVMKASEWVGKSSEHILVIQGPNANEWTGKGIVRMMQGEIIGNAEKYLNLLSIRTTANPTLGVLYQNLRLTLDNNLKKAKSKKRLPLIIGISIFFVIGIILTCAMVFDWDDKGGEKSEIQRLNDIELKIEKSMNTKDYDNALILTNQLNWNWEPQFDASKKRIEQYNLKREEYQTTINKLKNNKNGNN